MHDIKVTTFFDLTEQSTTKPTVSNSSIPHWPFAIVQFVLFGAEMMHRTTPPRLCRWASSTNSAQSRSASRQAPISRGIVSSSRFHEDTTFSRSLQLKTRKPWDSDSDSKLSIQLFDANKQNGVVVSLFRPYKKTLKCVYSLWILSHRELPSDRMSYFSNRLEI